MIAIAVPLCVIRATPVCYHIWARKDGKLEHVVHPLPPTFFHTPLKACSCIKVLSHSSHLTIFTAVANLIHLLCLSSEVGLRVLLPRSAGTVQTQPDSPTIEGEPCGTMEGTKFLKSNVSRGHPRPATYLQVMRDNVSAMESLLLPPWKVITILPLRFDVRMK